MSSRPVRIVLMTSLLLAPAARALAQQPAAPAANLFGPGTVVVLPAAAQEPAVPSDVTWDFEDGPSLRIGKAFRVDFTAVVQGDFRSYDPTPDDASDTEELETLRFGVEGVLFKIVEFEVKYDFQDDDQPWKDVYANLRLRDAFQVQGGHFKIPFGRERLRGVGSLDFIARTLVSEDLAPARDLGGMVHGRTRRSGVGYAVGYFRGEPEGAINRIAVPDFEALEAPDLEPTGPIWAGRVTVRPFRLAGAEGWFKDLEAGADVMTATLDEGLFGARGRSWFGPEYFPRVYVKGRRLGLGVDGAVEAGPFTVQAEYLRVTDDRENQGLGDETVPDLLAHGWWVAGTWVVTGQKKSRADEPDAWFPGRGFGAVELVTRFEQLRFRSVETGGDEPFRNPRATNLYPNSDTAWTGGVNWYLNRFVKAQVNAIREHIEDIERTLRPGQDTFWTYAVRLQVSM